MADDINKPPHYNQGKIEPIDVIEDWNLGFHLGNTVKYINRAPHKGQELKDLEKAEWYLKRRIVKLRSAMGVVISTPEGSGANHYMHVSEIGEWLKDPSGIEGYTSTDVPPEGQPLRDLGLAITLWSGNLKGTCQLCNTYQVDLNQELVCSKCYRAMAVATGV